MSEFAELVGEPEAMAARGLVRATFLVGGQSEHLT